MPTLQEMERTLEQKRGELARLFETHRKDGQYQFNADQLAEVNRRNDELTDLGKRYESMKSLAQLEEGNRAALDALKAAAPPPVPGAGPGGARQAFGAAGAYGVTGGFGTGAGFGAGGGRSVGELFVASPSCRDYKGGAGPISVFPDVDLKALFATTAGWAPQSLRSGRLVLSAQEPPAVVDLIPMTETQFPVVKYMEETTFTNAAAETAEAGTYAESSLALAEKTSNVQKIGTLVPVTDEQLEDVTQVRDYLDNRLTLMLKQRLDEQIVAGNGTAPNLRGILNVVGVQTQAKGTDPTPDAIYKAMTLVRTVGKAQASGVLFHPSDWQDVRLLRTADGIYIWGSPSESGPERIWGLPVAQSANATEGTAIVGAWSEFSELAMKRGIEVQVSNSHGTFFADGKQAIRADFRCALIFYRPAAFCKVTGL